MDSDPTHPPPSPLGGTPTLSQACSHYCVTHTRAQTRVITVHRIKAFFFLRFNWRQLDETVTIKVGMAPTSVLNWRKKWVTCKNERLQAFSITRKNVSIFQKASVCVCVCARATYSKIWKCDDVQSFQGEPTTERQKCWRSLPIITEWAQLYSPRQSVPKPAAPASTTLS